MTRDEVYEILYEAFMTTNNPQVAIYMAMNAMKFNMVQELDDDFHDWLKERNLKSPVAKQVFVSRPLGADYIKIAPNFYAYTGNKQ